MFNFSKSLALVAIFSLSLLACSEESTTKNNDTSDTSAGQDMGQSESNAAQDMGSSQGDPTGQSGQAAQQSQGTQPFPTQPGMQQQAPKLDVSEEELANFVTLAKQVETIGTEAEEEMLAVLDKTGMSVERFNQLQQAEGQQQLQQVAQGEELSTYTTSMEQIQEIQNRIDAEVEAKADDLGFTEDRFQQISMALRTDAQLMQRFQTAYMAE